MGHLDYHAPEIGRSNAMPALWLCFAFVCGSGLWFILFALVFAGSESLILCAVGVGIAGLILSAVACTFSRIRPLLVAKVFSSPFILWALGMSFSDLGITGVCFWWGIAIGIFVLAFLGGWAGNKAADEPEINLKE